jgi:hypothetical protein
MSTHARLVCLFILLSLSGVFAGAIVWLSPNPLPMAHTQLLTACIALFSASGIALVRMLNGPGTKNKDTPKAIDATPAPSIEGPDPDGLPPLKPKRSNRPVEQ